jgi:hypothetical protein
VDHIGLGFTVSPQWCCVKPDCRLGIEESAEVAQRKKKGRRRGRGRGRTGEGQASRWPQELGVRYCGPTIAYLLERAIQIKLAVSLECFPKERYVPFLDTFNLPNITTLPFPPNPPALTEPS